MVERLPEISNQPQSLEKVLQARKVFDPLEQEIKSLIIQIDKEESLLDPIQRENALAIVLWMNKPDSETIADLLRREDGEIDRIIKDCKNEKVIEAVSRLTKDGEREFPWGRQEQIPLTPKFKEEVRRLREKGLTQPQMAEELGVERSRVDYTIAVLIQEGKIKGTRRKRRSGARNSS